MPVANSAFVKAFSLTKSSVFTRASTFAKASADKHKSDWRDTVATKATVTFKKLHIVLTLGGEPTFLPIHPEGDEWSFTALGPTKLMYARKLANSLIKHHLPNSIIILSPGKFYPGEIDARWVLKVIQTPHGDPWFYTEYPKLTSFRAIKRHLVQQLQCDHHWMDFRDPRAPHKSIHVLPINCLDQKWSSAPWHFKNHHRVLTNANGPAGLRLPLHLLSDNELKSAIVLEQDNATLHVFIPPLSKDAFLELLPILGIAHHLPGIDEVEFHGYTPNDLHEICPVVCFAADPGVLEVNIPPCNSWQEYRRWLTILEQNAKEAGMRSWKDGHFPTGTGGGNHLIVGGPYLDKNPFFTRPQWVAAIIRYWQNHPSLAYAFTGTYVGPSSQAPRPDESGIACLELAMGLEYLESLQSFNGDDAREHIQQTLCHFLVDAAGNPHRSEISIDKFWHSFAPYGQMGLLEFRAIESLPHAEWSATVGLLWYAILARLAAKPYRSKLIDFSHSLHDTYMLPFFLHLDLLEILQDLQQHRFEFPFDAFTEILNWRFPILLQFEHNSAQLTVRKAHEPWPLLSETPTQGSLTSRFVDTSLRRIEFHANHQFYKNYHITINNRSLPLHCAISNHYISGCRYRHSKLFPCLHPHLSPQYPLKLIITHIHSGTQHSFTLEENDRTFKPIKSRHITLPHSKCRRHPSAFWTYDLRLN